MNQGNHLLRVLGAVFGLAAVVGAVVGQGILRTPGIVAEASGSVAILLGLWLLGAVAAALTAAPYAELGAAIPNAGGPIAFVKRAFGRRGEVAMAMTMLVMYCATSAVLCFVLGEFLVRLGVGGGAIGPATLAMGAQLLFALVNSVGTRASGGLQIALSTAKGLTLLALVIVLFAQPAAAPEPAATAGLNGWIPFGAAMLVIVGTYNGWADLVMYGEEITDPGRTVPRAMFGGIAGITVLYLLVNMAMFHVLPPARMAGSEFAAADAAGTLFGTNADTVFTAFGVLSVGAIANFGTMTNARLAFATARAGILPQWFTSVDRRGTPLQAVWGMALVSILFLLTGTYMALSSTSVSLSQAIFLAVILAALVLRRREPDLPRPWRVPAFGLIMALAILINAALLIVFVIQDPFYALLGFVLVAALTAGYFAAVRSKPAPESSVP